MHPADIQAELKKKGITQARLAEELNVDPMAVSRVIHRQLVSDRVMQAIAERVGRHHYEVFPEYYLGPKKRSTSKAIG